ncbi:hypothetical protein LIER_16154 [Lithospermum erythrorhizon]|uniref:Uncharacterized protein n=1 Tax=Lithospermum erythrorhizon TaxID=34254 RepID=A0AAV3Q851_LITER
MEQYRQGKLAKWIRKFGKRIGSEGWALGSQSRTRWLLADWLICSCGESGFPRAIRGTDWEWLLQGPPRASNNHLRAATDKGNPSD